MEKYSYIDPIINQVIKYAKGNKSHQLTNKTDTRIYFNSQGLPVNVDDDSLYDDYENHILDRWTHEYFYNLVETDPVTAINTYVNCQGSIVFEVTGKNHKRYYWDFMPNYTMDERKEKTKFTVEELLYGKWYLVVDAY